MSVTEYTTLADDGCPHCREHIGRARTGVWTRHEFTTRAADFDRPFAGAVAVPLPFGGAMLDAAEWRP